MNKNRKKFIINEIKNMLYSFRFKKDDNSSVLSDISEKAGINKNKHSIKGNLLRK